jgi:predicted DNA-binding antitoxin AbrB/MazE fold protein
MSKKAKLKEGQKVTILIEFTYTIGEQGYQTDKTIETIEDCMDEVRAEIDNGGISGSNVELTIGEISE